MTIYIASDLEPQREAIQRHYPGAIVRVSRFVPAGSWAIEQGGRLTFPSKDKIVEAKIPAFVNELMSLPPRYTLESVLGQILMPTSITLPPLPRPDPSARRLEFAKSLMRQQIAREVEAEADHIWQCLLFAHRSTWSVDNAEIMCGYWFKRGYHEYVQQQAEEVMGENVKP